MYEILHGAGCYGMLGGQVADVENESKEISGELLDYIHINKTAALIMAAVRAGCYLGCADSDILSNMTNYAEALGLAFQIKDAEPVLEEIATEMINYRGSGMCVMEMSHPVSMAA